MSNYRRIYLSDHIYFFTVVTHNRCNLFSDDKNVQLLKAAFRYVQSRKYFKIEAICILPDHLHCMWSMPEDGNYSKRWQMIKTNFSRQYRYENPEHIQKKLWQPRFWEHVIRDQDDWQRHLDYIHYNPVKHGLVTSAEEWKCSSFRKFCKHGFYDDGWGEAEPGTVIGMFCE